jgi:futalosine hydrolase
LLCNLLPRRADERGIFDESFLFYLKELPTVATGMKILLAAATYNEINTTAAWVSEMHGEINGHNVDVLVTGIGGTATAYALTRHLILQRPDLVIQAGIGGSFKAQLPAESVVFVKEEVFADLGAYENDRLSDIFDLGLAAADEKPFNNRMLINPDVERWARYRLPFVRGATINCISSTARQAQRIADKYDPDVESMEGAALHYVCLQEKIDFIQLRAVSNFVGERNKNNWRMKEAIAGLNEQLKEIILRES